MISSCSQICFQELTAEISELERQRDGLEAELKKVFLLSPSLSYLKPKKKKNTFNGRHFLVIFNSYHSCNSIFPYLFQYLNLLSYLTDAASRL